MTSITMEKSDVSGVTKSTKQYYKDRKCMICFDHGWYMKDGKILKCNCKKSK